MIERKILVVINETKHEATKEIISHLKDAVTKPILKIEQKGQAPRDECNKAIAWKSEYIIPLIMSVIIKYSIGDLDKGYQWTCCDILYWVYIIGLSYIIVRCITAK